MSGPDCPKCTQHIGYCECDEPARATTEVANCPFCGGVHMCPRETEKLMEQIQPARVLVELDLIEQDGVLLAKCQPAPNSACIQLLPHHNAKPLNAAARAMLEPERDELAERMNAILRGQWSESHKPAMCAGVARRFADAILASIGACENCMPQVLAERRKLEGRDDE